MTNTRTNTAAKPLVAPVLPSADFKLEMEPGGLKAVKTQHRRNDSMLWVDPRNLKVLSGFNARVHTESYKAYVRELAESMKADGFLAEEAIKCYVRKNEAGEDEMVVTDGHTRTEAVLLAISEGAQIDQVPVILRSKVANMADLTLDLVRANSGRPLTTYETAIVVKRLLNMGFEESEIVEKLRFTRTHIANLLLLSTAPKHLANLIAAEVVAAHTAIEAIRKHGPIKAEKILKEAADKAASGGGKVKVTNDALPGKRLQKAIKRTAPLLYESVREISKDPGYAGLREETRAKLDELLEQLAAQEPAETPAA